MLISCGEHSTADGCFIMLVLQTKKQAATVYSSHGGLGVNLLSIQKVKIKTAFH